MRKFLIFFFISTIIFSAFLVYSEETPEKLILPQEFYAIDSPEESTGSICLIWSKSPTEGKDIEYFIYQSTSKEGSFTEFEKIDSTNEKLKLSSNSTYFGLWKRNENYRYKEMNLTIKTIITTIKDISTGNELLSYTYEEPGETVEKFKTDSETGEEVFNYSYKDINTGEVKSGVFVISKRVDDKTKAINEVITKVIATRIDPKYFKLGMMRKTDLEPLMLPDIVTAQPRINFFKWSKLNNIVVLILMYIFVYYYINKAKKNPNIFLRKIAGLDAVDDAIGRATEMGKPILYSTGYYDASEISTIASINILGQVAKKVANYDSRIIIPCKWPVAMTVCQEVVKEAYIDAGRPDAYNPNDIFFIAGEQFSYTAAVNGLMVREKPAANFLLGTFAGESLLLAETGNTIGAIQIAGTDSVYQIPFFIAACDYCLIGEELYAASAYLSREPRIVGTLKGQDMGKILIVLAIVLGIFFVTLSSFTYNEYFNLIKYFFTVR